MLSKFISIKISIMIPIIISIMTSILISIMISTMTPILISIPGWGFAGIILFDCLLGSLGKLEGPAAILSRQCIAL